MQQIPTRLYQYQSPTPQSFKNLASQTLFFSNPSDFNDPYDCVIEPSIKHPTKIESDAIVVSLAKEAKSDPEAFEVLVDASQETVARLAVQLASNLIDNQRKAFNAGLGVVCFSETNNNLLMWSHYAAQHKGFCLEFDTNYDPLTKSRPVHYSKTIPQIDPMRIIVDRDLQVFMDLFCTKSIDWAYEREWRSMHFTPRKPYMYDANALTGVYLGSRMSESDQATLTAIARGRYPNAVLYKGRRSINRYEIAFDQIA